MDQSRGASWGYISFQRNQGGWRARPGCREGREPEDWRPEGPRVLPGLQVSLSRHHRPPGPRATPAPGPWAPGPVPGAHGLAARAGQAPGPADRNHGDRGPTPRAPGSQISGAREDLKAPQVLKEPANDIWITLYADSSPAAGIDIFGMIAEIWIGNVRRMIVLPGLVLGHGHGSALDKTMSLLWALYLIAGPSVNSLEAIILAVAAITTDQGVERLMVDMANVVDAFLCRLGLRSSRFYRELIYTFEHAVGIPDWLHLWSGIIKFGLESLDGWPGILQRLRSLSKFFNIEEYREVAAKHLKRQGRHDLAAKLKSFGVSAAKWRYHTHCLLVIALADLREICQNYLPDVTFGSMQDSQNWAAVKKCCQEAQIWIWLSVFSKWFAQRFIAMLNWGRGCACHRNEKDRSKILCGKFGQNLADAKAHIATSLTNMMNDASQISYSDCEQDREVWDGIKFVLRRAVSDANTKTKWVAEVPYAFSRLSDPAECAEIIKQWRSCPPTMHNRNTVRIMQIHEREIDSIARLETPVANMSADLRKIERVWKSMRIVSDVAEGYHRTCHVTKIRAPVSKASPHLPSSRGRGADEIRWPPIEIRVGAFQVPPI